ncbi:MAG: flagellin [Phycisphaerales bacterium]|nr:flagellin [Phycisphaerales bacterium]
MSRINTNVTSMIAVNTLNRNNVSLQTPLQRLSTGYRINSGKDDPAGLIASEVLRAEQRATAVAIGNAQRADSVIGTAEGALSEVSNLLVSLQGLIGSSANIAGMSQEERDANQLQVDSILNTINRISNSASFEGMKLLNGTFDYTTSGLATTSAFTNMSINSAKVPDGQALSVKVTVLTSAQHAQLNYLGTTSSVASSTNLSIAGNLGTVQLSFISATTLSAIVNSVNQFTDSTGIEAKVSSDKISIVFSSVGYGSSQFVSVTSSSPSAVKTSNITGTDTNRAEGRDATLTINGTAAISDGLNVKAVVGDTLDVSFTLNASINTGSVSKTFGILGGGATFSLGAQVNTANLASIGIFSVNTASLGKFVQNNTVYTLSDIGSGKVASVNHGDKNLAQSIVNQAIKDVSSLRGRLGAFQANTLASTINSLNVALENVSSSESAIRDTDFASETSNLTRNQILVQAATAILQQANSAPQNVLSLLR